MGEVAGIEDKVAAFHDAAVTFGAVDGIEMAAAAGADDAQLQHISQAEDRILLVALAHHGFRPQLQRQLLLAVELVLVLLLVGRPLQALALALDVAGKELRLVVALVSRGLHQIDMGAGHGGSRAVGNMAGDGAAGLREARNRLGIGAHQLVLALRAIGLHGVLVV